MLHFRSAEHGSCFLRSILLQMMAIAIGLTDKLKNMPPVYEPIDKGSGHDVTPEKGAQIGFEHCLRIHSGGLGLHAKRLLRYHARIRSA